MSARRGGPPPEPPGGTPALDVTLPDGSPVVVTPGHAPAVVALPEPPPRDGPGHQAPAGDLPWEAWAPPLDPPTSGALPYDQAAAITAAWWATDPHEAAAQMWEAYAAQLPPTPTVAQVATGSQSVSYSPPQPGGDYGLAISRAQWHRSFCSMLHSVPLSVGWD